MKIAPISRHGPLEELAPGMWQVVGSLPRGHLSRAMVVYRLADGGLWLHSAVAMDEAGMAALEDLGTPKVLVVPSGLHRLDAPFYRQRYADLRVVCPSAARSKVEKAVPVDGTCEDVLPGFGIVCHAPAGIRPSELAYELDLGEGRALVVSDLLFNSPHLPGVDGAILRLLGSTGFFGMTGIGRLLMLKDRRALAAWLREKARLPELRLISVAHGAPVKSECAAALEGAAARLEG